jgi:hypothetical protein
MSHLKEGRATMNMVYAGILSLAGLVGFYLSTWGNWTLSIRNHGLPTWTMQALSIVFFLIGVAWLVFGKETLCALCSKEMHEGTARFQLNQKDELMPLFQQGRFREILSLPWVGMGNSESFEWKERLDANTTMAKVRAPWPNASSPKKKPNLSKGS